MHNALFLFILSFFTNAVFSQLDTLKVDPHYLEDQLYFGTTYNTFAKTPSAFVQDGFSYGFSTGFIRDIPFNKLRNFGMGIGLGYSYNTFIQNLVAAENELEYSSTAYDDTYTLKTNSLELPIEIRWRTSTLEKYKFWRVYTGVSFSYILSSFAVGESVPDVVAITNAVEIQRFNSAVTLSVGYGTWNFYVNYSLTPFFNKNTKLINGDELDMTTSRLGLMFYLF